MDFAEIGYPGVVAIGTYSEWTYNSGRSPMSMPSDWGMEIDVYLTNPDPSFAGSRPNCGPGDWRNRFWAAKYALPREQQVNSWSISKSDGTALSAGSTVGSAEAYFDWDDQYDACNTQSFGIGIGKPAGIGMVNATTWGVNTNIWTAKGAVATSPMGGYYQAVSNDCNDAGIAADSACMGLNVNREFPVAGGQQRQLILNASTRTAAGCYATTAPNDGSPTGTAIPCYW